MFAHFTLPVVIFLSAFGALVMCLLLLRSGLLSGRASAGIEGSAELGGGRFGPAFGATCFVLIAVLAVVGLVHQGRAARMARTQLDVAPKIAELREQLGGLDARLAKAEAHMRAIEARAASADAAAGRVGERVSGLDRRIMDTQAAVRQLSSEVARAQAGTRQVERSAAAEPARTRRGAAPIEPRAVPRPPASLSSAPSASPPTELPPPRPVVRVTPETTGPGVPPVPTLALPSPAAPSPPAADRADRVAPPSAPASNRASSTQEPSKSDLKAQMRDDWETVKRDARTTGNEIKDAFRKFRDWIKP